MLLLKYGQGGEQKEKRMKKVEKTNEYQMGYCHGGCDELIRLDEAIWSGGECYCEECWKLLNEEEDED